jgi:hypothetical protein
MPVLATASDAAALMMASEVPAWMEVSEVPLALPEVSLGQSGDPLDGETIFLMRLRDSGSSSKLGCQTKELEEALVISPAEETAVKLEDLMRFALGLNPAAMPEFAEVIALMPMLAIWRVECQEMREENRDITVNGSDFRMSNKSKLLFALNLTTHAQHCRLTPD